MDEDTKQRAMVGFIAFNFTFMIAMIVFAVTGMFDSGFVTRALIAAAIGGAVGGVAFGATYLMK